MTGSFDSLSPELVLEAVESAFELRMDGTIQPYSSYVNRVYGLRGESGGEYVAKFYRPGRWTADAILEEHRFLDDCLHAELPVVGPIVDASGSTLPELEVESEDSSTSLYRFALFPKRGGRGFDAEEDSDWRRLGALSGRLHAVGALRAATHRTRLNSSLVLSNLEELEPAVHPEFRGEFMELCRDTISGISEPLDSSRAQRIHGDLHRGNILERPGEGLILLDFDDMMTGPPVQDLWLLLPGRSEECGREWSLLVEGYSEFAELEAGSRALIEPLRFCRMLHFLVWRMRQRDDLWFAREFPDWGGRAFWIRELEDFRDQARVLSD
ncbi:MAG: serine/threonine protein kinase [Rectinemataceae bacterium]